MAEWRLPYSKIRPGIRPGDAIAFHGTKAVSKGIALYEKFKTGAEFSTCITHIASAVSGPIVLDRKLMIEANEGEVNARSISSVLTGYSGTIWWYPLREELSQYREAMDLRCWETIGTKYDFGSFFRNLSGNVLLDIRRLFCSELLQYSLEAIPHQAICDLLRHLKKQAIDFPELDLMFAKVALRPNQLVQLPFYRQPVEILV